MHTSITSAGVPAMFGPAEDDDEADLIRDARTTRACSEDMTCLAKWRPERTLSATCRVETPLLS